MNYEQIQWQSSQNQKSLSFQLTSMSELSIYKEYLLSNLKKALQTNKELILTSLFSNYYTPTSDVCSSPIHQTKEENKESKNSDEALKQDFNKNDEKQLTKKSKMIKKRETYDTKNIPKNFGTAIYIFMKRNTKKIKNLLEKKKISFSQFYQFNKAAKQKINSLLHLRQLWDQKEDDTGVVSKLKECYRILSFEFMRKHCLNYIFTSRIKNCSSHIRYRVKLLEGLERPQSLFNLKDY